MCCCFRPQFINPTCLQSCEITLRSKQDTQHRATHDDEPDACFSYRMRAQRTVCTHACTTRALRPIRHPSLGSFCTQHVRANNEWWRVGWLDGGGGVAHHPLNKFPTRCAEYLLSVFAQRALSACQLMCRITTAPGSSSASRAREDGRRRRGQR